jgi:heptosyltransferase-1
VLPWGDANEKQRAERIKRTIENQLSSLPEIQVTPWVPENKLNLTEMVQLLKNANAVVSVDTGLSHVAAALEVPMVVLYRVTDPEKVGALGSKVTHLISPLAKNYLKKFNRPAEEKNSLKGLGVKEVIKATSPGETGEA